MRPSKTTNRGNVKERQTEKRQKEKEGQKEKRKTKRKRKKEKLKENPVSKSEDSTTNRCRSSHNR